MCSFVILKLGSQNIYITFTFSHLADAFIQSDLQLGVHKAPLVNVWANSEYQCFDSSDSQLFFFFSRPPFSTSVVIKIN